MTNLVAQDERYFRKFFTGELLNENREQESYKIEVASKFYLIDLNRNKRQERVRTLKKDGLDFLEIQDRFGNVVFNHKLKTMGADSKIYKLQLKTISNQTDVLIIHFYEGYTAGVTFEATARLYFLTIQNRDLSKMYLFEGPHFFHEKEFQNEKYIKRKYSVNVLDYNNNNRNEISVTFNKIQHIYFYIRNGMWKRL